MFLDPDIILATDVTSFSNLEYTGTENQSIYDGRDRKTTEQTVFTYRVVFDDQATCEVWAAPDFNNEANARIFATRAAQALGRIPRQLRQGVQVMVAFNGDGRANADLGKKRIRIYKDGTNDNLLEELLVHEAAHVSLDPEHRFNSDWLFAQSQDRTFISTYARDNYLREDIAESVLPYLAIRFHPTRISASMERTIQSVNAHRIAFFDQIITDVYPLTDESAKIKARFTQPTIGTLAASEINFEWSIPDSATQYDLILGTRGYGSDDIRDSNRIANNNFDAFGLPDDGGSVYARLWTFTNNEWRYDDYRCPAYSINQEAAEIRSPVPGSTLATSSATFRWDWPTGASEFNLEIGTQGAGSDDIRSSQVFSDSNSLTVNNLPENEENIYVRLWTNKNGWSYNDYQYKASATRAKLLSPVPNSKLQNKNVTFSWNKPFGASSFDLLVGTNGPGSTNIRATNVIGENELTLNNVPTDGRKIYVRLWTYKKQWLYIDYVFND